MFGTTPMPLETETRGTSRNIAPQSLPSNYLRGHNLSLSRQESLEVKETKITQSHIARFRESRRGGIVLRIVSVIAGAFLELTVVLEVARTLTNMGNTLNNVGADVTYGIVGVVGLVFIGLGIAAGGRKSTYNVPAPNSIPYSFGAGEYPGTSQKPAEPYPGYQASLARSQTNKVSAAIAANYQRQWEEQQRRHREYTEAKLKQRGREQREAREFERKFGKKPRWGGGLH